jgi:hypothetical protein
MMTERVNGFVEFMMAVRKIHTSTSTIEGARWARMDR